MKAKHRLTVLCLLAALAAGFAAKLYWIGEPVDGAQLHCTTSVEGQILTLTVETEEPAMALRGLEFCRESDTMLIHLHKVPVSPVCSENSTQATLNLDGIRQVRLGGQTIWTAEN